MFLRHKMRRKDGKEHRYWSIVENRRVSGGRTVQRHVLYLGEINDAQRAAWCQTIEAFDEGGQQAWQIALFPEDRAAPARTAMWFMSGSAGCGSIGRGNGVPAGWPAIFGISSGWMTSGLRVCTHRGRGHAGWTC
jgi:hypothetical protein